jgi:hypothetical protein
MTAGVRAKCCGCTKAFQAFRAGSIPVARLLPRGVAQSGSAPGWGPGGRRFKSCLPDTFSLTEPQGTRAKEPKTLGIADGDSPVFGAVRRPHVCETFAADAQNVCRTFADGCQLRP